MKTNPSTNGNYDVIVAGGGPAGSALATFVTRAGYRCLVLEGSKFPRYHIGESLIPHTYGTLDRLGLLPQLRASDFPVKHSVRFVDPDGRESTPFYFSETIPGDRARTWQVKRSEFDRIMRDHARANGVEFREETRVESAIQENGSIVGVQIRDGSGEASALRARVVVDATGRRCLIGRQLGLWGQITSLRKAAVWGYFKGGKRLPGIDAGETTMFLIPDGGWFWYIPLPDDFVSVGLVASPEYVFASGDSMEEIYAREVRKCAPLWERLAEAEQTSTVHSLNHMAYLNRQTCGDGWVMIGDARAFLDPIYSSGLYLALGSAELAAQCIIEGLANDDVSAAQLGKFEPALWAGVDVIRRLIYAFYDPQFSFGDFARRFPEQRAALIDCLIGDVVNKDMTSFMEALGKMSPAPPPLASS